MFAFDQRVLAPLLDKLIPILGEITESPLFRKSVPSSIKGSRELTLFPCNYHFS